MFGKMPRVGEVELAKALGRHRMAVRVAKRDGRLTPGPDGLYDLDEAIAEFNATTNHEKGHNNRSARSFARAAETPAGDLPEMPEPEIVPLEQTQPTTFAKARANREIYEAKLKKLRYEERAKTLVPADDVESARFLEFRILRDACFNIPSRIAALLAGESDLGRCQQILEAEINNVFTAFADGKLAT
jgi:hypothetical protein